MQEQTRTRSLSAAFGILRALAERSGGTALTEIQQRTKLHKSTCINLLRQLETLGLVARSEMRGYTPGTALIWYGEAAARQGALLHHCQPALRELNSGRPLTVVVAREQAGQITVIDTMEPKEWRDKPHVGVSLEKHVLTIRLQDVANRNSMSERLRSELGEAVRRAQSERAVRAVFLTATGPAFCAGGDLTVLRTASDPWSVYDRFAALENWLLPLLRLEKPVVIGMNGVALGGGIGLALCGDLIIAGQSARFVPGFFRIGGIPDMGVMYHLPRMIGIAAAKNFLFGEKPLEATEALALGLVSRVVPDAELEETGLAEARRLAQGPTAAMGLAKKIISRSFESNMENMFGLESMGQALSLAHPDFREGLAAVMERRKPDFTMSDDIEPSQENHNKGWRND